MPTRPARPGHSRMRGQHLPLCPEGDGRLWAGAPPVSARPPPPRLSSPDEGAASLLWAQGRLELGCRPSGWGPLRTSSVVYERRETHRSEQPVQSLPAVGTGSVRAACRHGSSAAGMAAPRVQTLRAALPLCARPQKCSAAAAVRVQGARRPVAVGGDSRKQPACLWVWRWHVGGTSIL